LLDAAGEGVWALDVRGHCTFANPAGAALLGLIPDQLVGRDLHELLVPHGVDVTPYPRVAWPLLAVLRGGETVHAAGETVLRSDGARIPVEYCAAPIAAGTGVAGAVVTVRDIGPRVRREAALRASEARHRAVVDTAHDAIVTMGADGTIRAFNRGAERIFGYVAADVLGAPLTLLMPAGLARHLATGTARVLGRPLDLAGRRADGTEFPLELTIAAWEEGGEAAFTGILRDVGAREARLAEAQRVAGLGSWEFDYATRALAYSDEAFRIGGHAPQAWTPTSERFLAAVHPADPARVGTFLAHARAGAEPVAPDYRLVRPDGAVRVVHQRAALLRDAAGRPTTLVGTVLDVAEQRTLEDWLAHQATHDELTHLPNRALFLDRLEQTLGRARAGEAPGAVLFLDLDHFKDVNDSRGHNAGDRLLVDASGIGSQDREKSSSEDA